MIQKVEEDPEGDYKIIDIDLYARIKAHCFTRVFRNAKNQPEKMGAREFMKLLKESLPKEMRLDTNLVEEELKIADLARRIKNFE